MGDIDPIHLDGSAIGFNEAEDAFDSNRFARTRAANDNKRFARRYFQIHAVEHDLLAEAFVNIGEFNFCGHAFAPVILSVAKNLEEVA
jgi:hypothetical protein